MLREIFILQNPWRYRSDHRFTEFDRPIKDELVKNLSNNKILGLIGSRQVGKSSLLYLLIRYLFDSGEAEKDQIYYFNLDDLKLHELFYGISELTEFIGTDDRKKYLFIDEIQRLENPGLLLKEIYDLKLNLKIVFSGSSQLEMKSKIREHMTGRARLFEIQRLSFEECLKISSPASKMDVLSDCLIYGGYPEVVLTNGKTDKKLCIKDIYQSYVQKDITDFLQISNVQVFNKLLVMLASQIGQLMNVNELSKKLRIDRRIVDEYIEIFEGTFIIKKVFPFHRNYKKEIVKTPKIYFMDLGLRNYVLKEFKQIDERQDVGALFENFIFLELLQKDFYGLSSVNFWRTTNQTEIDFIVENEKGLKAIETKWRKGKQPRSFQTIRKYYPEIETNVLTAKGFIENF